MKEVYKAKKLIVGGFVTKKLKGKTLVGVPKDKGFKVVEYRGDRMNLEGQEKLKEIWFNDNWGRGIYALEYYEWNPTPNPQMKLFS